MTFICPSIVHIKLLDDVSQKMKFRIFFHSTINKRLEAISALRNQLLKFYHVIFIGQLYFEIFTLYILHVICVNEWRVLHKES